MATDFDTTAITQWLIAWSNGRRDALERLMPVVHEDLHRLAAGFMRREPAGHTCSPRPSSTKRTCG